MHKCTLIKLNPLFFSPSPFQIFIVASKKGIVLPEFPLPYVARDGLAFLVFIYFFILLSAFLVKVPGSLYKTVWLTA
jgi:hypothetical protein